MVAPFIGQKIGEDQKKKKGSSLQNELVFNPQVCDDPPKKGLCLPISGFSVSKEKKNIWCHPGQRPKEKVFNFFFRRSTIFQELVQS